MKDHQEVTLVEENTMVEKNTEQSPQRRSIRSFVLRKGRMTPGQKRALEEQWPKLGLSVADGPLNSNEAFGRSAPTVLEIGFGMGHSLITMAKSQAEKNFIGVEVHPPGVGKLLQMADEEDVTNLRVYAEDAIDVLKQCIPDESLDELLLFFPDPWHKKKHHKRRIVQPEFVQLVRQKLRVGGVFHLATDWEHYAEHMLEVLEVAEGFKNYAEPAKYAERPSSRPVTKFERRGERLGHGVWDLLFERTE